MFIRRNFDLLNIICNICKMNPSKRIKELKTDSTL